MLWVDTYQMIQHTSLGGSGSTQALIATDLSVVGREEVVRVPVAVSRGQDGRPLAPAIDRRAAIMAESPSASSVNGMALPAPFHLPSGTGIPLVMIAMRRIDRSIADVLLSTDCEAAWQRPSSSNHAIRGVLVDIAVSGRRQCWIAQPGTMTAGGGR